MKTAYQNLIQKISNHYGLKRYAKNTIWVFIGKIGNLLISFLATLYIARTLGPSNYGELAYALGFVGLFSFIGSFGIDAILYRDLIKYPDKKNVYLGTAWSIRIFTALLAVIVTITTAWFYSPPDVSFVLICILVLTFVFQSFYIISNEFGAAVQNKAISLLSLAINIILNLGKITVIYTGNGVIYLAGILLMESILYAGGYVYLRQRIFGTIKNWSFSYPIAKSLLYDSWPLMFTSAFTMIYARMDMVMLKNFINSGAAGVYDAAVRLSELWYAVPTIIVGSLYPALINAQSSSRTEYKRRIKWLCLGVFVISLIVTSLVTILADEIVELVYGEAFHSSARILQIYIWGFIPISITILVNQVLLAENARPTLFFSSITGMIINLIGNYYLIPLYQSSGAAVASVIASCIVLLVVLVIYGTMRLKKKRI